MSQLLCSILFILAFALGGVLMFLVLSKKTTIALRKAYQKGHAEGQRTIIRRVAKNN